MRDGQVVLSGRLQMLADMVTKGHRTADVGCDHGFLSIYLVQQGICPRVLAMDVRKGPLAAARGHVAVHGLETYIETRLSDGLAALRPGEAETLVCAGMGGPLMEKILREGMDKARSLKELILQPQSEIGAFRCFLREEGFRILAEDAVREDGKYYFAMKAAYAGSGGGESLPEARRGRETAQDRSAMSLRGSGGVSRAIADEYGELLLREGHPVLKQYLDFRKGVLEQIEGRLLACARGGMRDARAEAGSGRTEAGSGRAAAAGGTEAGSGRTAARLAQVQEELRGVYEALRQWDDPPEAAEVKHLFDKDAAGRR